MVPVLFSTLGTVYFAAELKNIPDCRMYKGLEVPAVGDVSTMAHIVSGEYRYLLSFELYGALLSHQLPSPGTLSIHRQLVHSYLTSAAIPAVFLMTFSTKVAGTSL